MNTRRDFLNFIGYLTLGALPGCEAGPRSAAPARQPEGAKTEPELPLFKYFPALKKSLPHIRLASLPTPVEELKSLAQHANLGRLYIKRDDLCGNSYGGSKIRKLEWLLGDAVHSKKRGVITFGAAGSNHAVATALYSKQLNLQCLLMLLPQPPSEDIRHKLLASHTLGARIQIRPTLKAAQRAAERMVNEDMGGDSFYIVESGGSSPLGNLGLVNAAFELKEQIDAGLLPEPDFIYMALGTMGSAVGLLLGLKAAGLKSTFIPVRASSLETSGERQFMAMFDAALETLRRADPSFPKLLLPREELHIEGRYLGGGYGIKTSKGEQASSLFHEKTGFHLEQTYTAKTLAALLDNAAALQNKSILFWNTFGPNTIPVEMTDPESLPAEVRAFFKGNPQ